MAFINLNVNDLPASTGNFELIPAGWYDSIINEAAIAQTKSGNGEYIKLKICITGPTHQGRTVYANLNIKNQSSVAEEIGRQQEASWGRGD